MTKRALILGGGGPVGVAWEFGMLAGLLDAGVDVRDAALIVGTSAGSIVGTHIGHGRDARELLERLHDDAGPRAGAPERDMQSAAQAFGLWASYEAMTPEHCADVGAVAIKAKTIPEADWVASFEAQDWDGWPSTPLLITAVDCESGAFRAFDAASDVVVQRATAASCAVPAIAPPVSIDGRRYMDGGVRSGTSADLAVTIEPSAALIIAPLGSGTAGIHPLCRRQIVDERAQLQAVGARVAVVHMDEATMAAGGGNLMDFSRRVPASVAGRAQGSRIAVEIRALWLS